MMRNIRVKLLREAIEPKQSVLGGALWVESVVCVRWSSLAFVFHVHDPVFAQQQRDAYGKSARLVFAQRREGGVCAE